MRGCLPGTWSARRPDGSECPAHTCAGDPMRSLEIFRFVAPACLLFASLLAACDDAAGPAEEARGPWRAVAAGSGHTCALDTTGAAYCWGRASSGELGTGVVDAFAPGPRRVSGGLTFTALAAGDRHTCGLTAEGAAYCWGENQTGQLGRGDTTSTTAPVRVAGGHHFTRITAGWLHNCALDEGGEAYCWGLHAPGAARRGKRGRRVWAVLRPLPV